MRNLKRALSLALAAVMLIGMMVVGTGAVSVDDFSDANAVTDREAVGVITGLGIMAGKSNGNFDPAGNFTRAEMAVVLCRLMYGSSINPTALVDSNPVFTDMNGHWAIAWVNLASSLGLVSGMGDGTFEPDSNVSAVDAAVMIEKALGLAPTTGSWPTAFMLKANELELFSGLGALPYDGALTREQVSKVALNAMFVSASGERSYRVGNETFTNAADAYFYQQGLPAENRPTIVIDTPKDSWAANFGLVVDDNARDEFGRTYTKYTSTSAQYKDLDVAISAAAVSVSYTTAVTEKQLFADLGVTGRRDGTTSAFDYYVVMDEIWLNGVQVAGSKELTSGRIKYYGADPAFGGTAFDQSVVIAKNDSTSVRGSGNGTTIEVYPNGTANHYRMVIIDEYVATLDSGDIHAATPTAEAYVTIDAPRVFDTSRRTDYTTDEFKAGDVVLYTMANSEIASMKLADRVDSVSITGYTGAVANGIYTLSKNVDGFSAWGTSDLGKAYDLYLDSCGNVICRANPGGTPVAAVTEFAYILKAEGTAPSDATLSNPNAGDYTLKVRAVLGDGTVKIYDVPVSKAPTASSPVTAEETKALNDARTRSGIADLDFGDYYTAGVIVWDADSADDNEGHSTKDKAASLEGKVYGYSLRDNNLSLSKVTPVSSANLTEGKIYVNKLDSAYTTASGLGIDASNGKNALISSNTVFVVINADTNKATAYTGSISTKSTGLSTANSWVVMTAASNTAGIANVVFTTDHDKVAGAVSNAAGYAYVDASKVSVSGTSSKPVYTYTGLDQNNGSVVLTSDSLVSTGVYAFNENGTIGDAQTAYPTTVIDEMINCNGWMNLALGVQYVYADGMDKADGNMCVVITDSAGRVTTVFVVSAPHVHNWVKVEAVAADCDTEGGDAYYHCSDSTCASFTAKKASADGTGGDVVWQKDADAHDSGKTLTWKVAVSGDKNDADTGCTVGNHYQFCDKCGAAVGAGHTASFETCSGTSGDNHKESPVDLACEGATGCTITSKCEVDHQ